MRAARFISGLLTPIRGLLSLKQIRRQQSTLKWYTKWFLIGSIELENFLVIIFPMGLSSSLGRNPCRAHLARAID